MKKVWLIVLVTVLTVGAAALALHWGLSPLWNQPIEWGLRSDAWTDESDRDADIAFYDRLFPRRVIPPEWVIKSSADTYVWLIYECGARCLCVLAGWIVLVELVSRKGKRGHNINQADGGDS